MPVPPLAVAFIVALFPPKQETFVDVTLVHVSCVGCVIFTVVETLHPLASVAVME